MVTIAVENLLLLQFWIKAVRNRVLRQKPDSQRALQLELLESRQLLAADMVEQWNDHLIEAIRRDTTSPGPTWASRNMAIVQLAVYDAVNAIARTHSNYMTNVVAPSSASKEAAVAAAAYTTLVGLYPAQKSIFDQQLTAALATIVDGAAETAGVDVGKQVGQQMMQLRANDGSQVSGKYTVIDEPGHWSPDPTIAPTQTPLGVNWGKLTPMAMQDAADFHAPPPPDLNSQAYLQAYNEVKSLGAKDSTTRTADQEEIGYFWAYDRGGMGPPTILYNQSARKIAAAKGTTLEENARLLALINLAMAESGIVAWQTKYEYDFWRPITAIRQAAADGNPATVGDPNWVPLGAPGGANPDFTPPFPAYTSGHATFGAAAFHTLARYYGSDDFTFTLTSDELPGVTRTFHSFRDAAEENGISRIYLGIHWNFDNIIGQQQGNAIADYVYERFLVPLSGASVAIQHHGGGYNTVVLDDGPARIAVRRSGNILEIANTATSEVILSEQLQNIASIRFTGGNSAADMFVVDANYGGAIALPGGIHVIGAASEGDGFWFHGLDSADSVTLNGDSLTANGLRVSLQNISVLGISTHAGADTISITGKQAGRRIDLEGGSGNDTYAYSGQNGVVTLVDVAGKETLDFSKAIGGVYINLALDNGQRQWMGAGSNSVAFQGTFEDVIGTLYLDSIRGNAAVNYFRGLPGNDLLAGEGGNDILDGGDGHDIMLGGDGNDVMTGGWGRDLMVGGRGSDTVTGGPDEDLIIGGILGYEYNDVALRAIVNEWATGRSRSARMANLTGQSNDLHRLNGHYYLKTGGSSPTVRDDGASDVIYGDPNVDWIFIGTGDIIRT